MLYQPTGVGLRYGHPVASLAAFLGSSGPTHSAWPWPHLALAPRSPHPGISSAMLPTGLDAHCWALDLPRCVPASLKRRRTGRD